MTSLLVYVLFCSLIQQVGREGVLFCFPVGGAIVQVSGSPFLLSLPLWDSGGTVWLQLGKMARTNWNGGVPSVTSLRRLWGTTPAVGECGG